METSLTPFCFCGRILPILAPKSTNSTLGSKNIPQVGAGTRGRRERVGRAQDGGVLNMFVWGVEGPKGCSEVCFVGILAPGQWGLPRRGSSSFCPDSVESIKNWLKSD